MISPPRAIPQFNSNPVDWSRQRDLYFGPYIQDDWKITRRLTLNPGFRYDLYTQPVDALNTCGMFSPNDTDTAGRRGVIIAPGTRGIRALSSRDIKKI
jgi:outer membrane receptor protein involved in Fe transport